jgi:mannosyl-3-phosphoglycerate phosphatase
MQKHWLVFTDLDGTLLDHHTYSFDAALPALNFLKAQKIPVILNSSKTLAELSQIADELALHAPLIAENGSLIFYPDTGKKHLFGHDYGQICEYLDFLRAKHHYQFSGFHDWSVADIAEVTGLPVEAATAARQREASEPLLWHDSEERLQVFRQQLEDQHLSLKRGGRFWHIMGQTDKVKAMQFLQQEYTQSQQTPISTIALGDGPNDRDMLVAADIAVIVFNPDGTELALGHDETHREGQRIIRTQLAGPNGWNETILNLPELQRPLHK